MLIVKIDLEQNKENYRKVAELLQDLDIVSMAWEDEVKVKTDIEFRSGSTGDDLGKSVSAAIDKMEKRHGRN